MKKIPRVAYTLEFKLEALRRVRGGEAVRKVARELGVPERTEVPSVFRRPRARHHAAVFRSVPAFRKTPTAGGVFTFTCAGLTVTSTRWPSGLAG